MAVRDALRFNIHEQPRRCRRAGAAEEEGGGPNDPNPNRASSDNTHVQRKLIEHKPFKTIRHTKTLGEYEGIESVDWELWAFPEVKTLFSEKIVFDVAVKLRTTVFQKHHLIPNEVYKAFKTDLKAMGWKQNNMFNLKKLPVPFHGNHPAYNSFIFNEMNLLKQSGNLNINSMQNLQFQMRLMVGDAYRSGGTLNQYFKY